VLILWIHETVRLIYHVLLAPSGIFEHPTAKEAQVTQMNSFSNISHQTFEVN